MQQFNKKFNFLQILGIIAFTILFIFMVFQFELFLANLKILANAVMPFVVGLVVAFILNVTVRLFENHIFAKITEKFKKGKIWNKIRRPITITISYLVIFSIVSLIIFFVIPELTSSITNFLNTAKTTLPRYIQDVYLWLNNIVETFDLNIDLVYLQEKFLANFDLAKIFDGFSSATSGFFMSLINTTKSVANWVVTIFFSLIYSVYFLAGKERHILSFKKLLYTYVPRKKANTVSMFLSLCNKVFSDFVRTQITECIILGTLCFLGMTIIGLDYALLISTIVTLGALIPLLGTYISLGVGFVLLLMVNPMDAIWFLIFFFVLQQFEGNVIYPKVVGSSLGLPEVWTLTSVMVFGSLFGLAGILTGPPIFAVFYRLLKHNSAVQLRAKDIDEDVLNGNEMKILYKDILDPEPEDKDKNEIKISESPLVQKIKESLKINSK